MRNLLTRICSTAGRFGRVIIEKVNNYAKLIVAMKTFAKIE